MHGHATAAQAIAVAATPAAAALNNGPNAGPYPNPFTTADKIERMNAAGISVAERIEDIPALVKERLAKAGR